MPLKDDLNYNVLLAEEVSARIAGDIPPGGIVMWSGSIASIPSGWALCNGTNGTPNLQDRFIVAAGSGYGVGATGGESTHTLTTAEMPAHGHGFTTGGQNIDHQHNLTYSLGGAGSIYSVLIAPYSYYGDIPPNMYGASANHSHSGNTNNTGNNNAHENRPYYYALAFIMKL